MKLLGEVRRLYWEYSPNLGMKSEYIAAIVVSTVVFFLLVALGVGVLVWKGKLPSLPGGSASGSSSATYSAVDYD